MNPFIPITKEDDKSKQTPIIDMIKTTTTALKEFTKPVSTAPAGKIPTGAFAGAVDGSKPKTKSDERPNAHHEAHQNSIMLKHMEGNFMITIINFMKRNQNKI